VFVGQKAHPYGLRLGYIRDWKSKWFARKELKDLLHEDLRIRKFLTKKLKPAGVADIIIERSAGKVRISIFTARPGIIIGRGGQEIRCEGRGSPPEGENQQTGETPCT